MITIFWYKTLAPSPKNTLVKTEALLNLTPLFLFSTKVSITNNQVTKRKFPLTYLIDLTTTKKFYSTKLVRNLHEINFIKKIFNKSINCSCHPIKI